MDIIDRRCKNRLGKIAEIAISCITAVGGIGAVFVGVIKWTSNIIADKLSQKYQLQLDKEKEKYKCELSKKEYVSKTRFDTEFSIYRELTSVFSVMVKDISILVPRGLDTVPADENARKELEKKRFITANHSTVAAQDALFANATFIPQEFCTLFQELLSLSRKQLFAFQRRYNVMYYSENKESFTDEEYERTETINKKWENITTKIREYLSSLDVVS